MRSWPNHMCITTYVVCRPSLNCPPKLIINKALFPRRRNVAAGGQNSYDNYRPALQVRSIIGKGQTKVSLFVQLSNQTDGK